MSMPSYRTQSAALQRGITRVEVVVAIAVLWLGVLLLWPLFANAHESARRSGCVNNLRQLGLVLALYANENQDQFPPLDQRPGNLIFDGDLIHPQYLADVNVLGCPSDPRFDPNQSFRLARTSAGTGRFRVGDPYPACIDTTSYMYLGRLIINDDDLHEYRETFGDLAEAKRQREEKKAREDARRQREQQVRDAGRVPPEPMAIPLPSPEAGMRVSDATRGTLLFRSTHPGVYVPAPTLDTDVSMQVTGIVARATVRQRFHNPGTTWAEGVYVFPLPENAAVDRLRLHIGNRVIEGEIQERGEARRTYEQAKAAGQRTSLVEQERPNIFTTSVANVAPHEEVTVEIEYQQTLRYDAGVYRLRFPMTVGVRYIPGPPTAWGTPHGTGWSANTQTVPDASRITPPVRPKGAAPINPVRMQIDLDAGVPLARIESPYHDVRVDYRADGTHGIALGDGAVPADRDFELVWEPLRGYEPAAALFAEHHGGMTYALAMVMPPQPAEGETQRVPREVTFILDRSGSMQGHSIAQARTALKLALGTLQPQDTFNVITFSDTTDAFFPAPQPAARQYLDQALVYIDRIAANGGTEMYPALDRALNQSRDEGRLRQIIFITDGQVGNEAQLFALIQRQLGNARLFTVGIGAAPNSHFMTKAAQFGRGTYTFIAHTAEIQAQMDALFRKVEHPALADISISAVGGAGMELMPAYIPDLYLGEPVVVTARFTQSPDALVVRGRTGGSTWETRFPMAQEAPRAGVAVLWARRMIDALQHNSLTPPGGQTVRSAVLDLALQFHLVSPYTSLVAVDHTPARYRSERLDTHAVPTNLPYGWENQGVPGQFSQPAQFSRLLPLGNGVERFLMTDVNTTQVGASMAAAADSGSGDVPIFWDRPAIGKLDFAHETGQNILFLDGHVEFHRASPHNDTFPTTPYAQAWMAKQLPAPAGFPGDAWADCTDYVSAMGQALFRAQRRPDRYGWVRPACTALVVLLAVAVFVSRLKRPAPDAPPETDGSATEVAEEPTPEPEAPEP